MKSAQEKKTPRREREEVRLFALEQGQEAHARQIEQLAHAVARQGRQFQAAVTKQGHHLSESLERQAKESRRQFQEIRREIADIGRPKWNTYIAAAVFGLTLIMAASGTALAPLYLTTSTLWERVELNEERQREHERLDGHPTNIARIEALERTVGSLESRTSDHR